MNDTLDFASIQARIRALNTTIGLPLSVVAHTGSTNEDATKAGVSGATHGALFVAEAQSAGRGRLGRTWYSPSGQNLYMSLLLRPSGDAGRLASVTLVAGIAVAEAAGRFLPEGAVGIKWPNDVWVGQRKLAGILVEASTTQGRVDQVVVGIGLNVHQTEFDPEIRDIATSLAVETGHAPSRIEVLVAILEGLDTRLKAFDDEGLAPMLERLRELDVLRGKAIRVNDVEGTGDGIDEGGRLRIRTASGGVTLVHAGEVKLVRE